MGNIPSQEKTSLGVLDHYAVRSSFEALTKKKKRKDSIFSDEESNQTGQYASVHGPTVTVKKFKKTHLHLNFGESTTRSFGTKYQKLLKKEKQSSNISLQKTDRPLLLGTLDKKVKTFPHVFRRKGGMVNTVLAVATAKPLTARSPDEHLKCLDLNSSYWTKSLFTRLGFTKQTCITSKQEIPELARKETKLIFQHQIDDLVKRHSISLSLVINFD